MLDRDGFRLNVGMVIANAENKLLWCRRFGRADAWQFPQGGVQANETLKETMYRELKEEIGLTANDVGYLSETKRWLKYYLPEHYRRYHIKPLCIGQKQKWFLLRFISCEENIHLNHTKDQEFDTWQWVDYWHPLEQVISFKKEVYQKVLEIFEPILFAGNK